MKIYKLEVVIIDLDEVGEAGIIDLIETTKYPNHCIAPRVKRIDSREIGEWHDDHPLNKISQAEAEYQRLFASDNF